MMSFSIVSLKVLELARFTDIAGARVLDICGYNIIVVVLQIVWSFRIVGQVFARVN